MAVITIDNKPFEVDQQMNLLEMPFHWDSSSLFLLASGLRLGGIMSALRRAANGGSE